MVRVEGDSEFESFGEPDDFALKEKRLGRSGTIKVTLLGAIFFLLFFSYNTTQVNITQSIKFHISKL